jgi:hypothetical protein
MSTQDPLRSEHNPQACHWPPRVLDPDRAFPGYTRFTSLTGRGDVWEYVVPHFAPWQVPGGSSLRREMMNRDRERRSDTWRHRIAVSSSSKARARWECELAAGAGHLRPGHAPDPLARCGLHLRHRHQAMWAAAHREREAAKKCKR